MFKIQGRADIPLNETGRRQASITAEYLQNEHWDKIYSSPLIRAMETAQIISKAAGLSTITTESALLERDFGPADGMLIEEFRKTYPDWTKVGGAEDLSEIRKRAVNILTEISERHKDKRIIIVSHAVFIMQTLGAFSNDQIQRKDMKLKNLSMSLLTRDDDWNIPWYNRSAMDREPASAL